MIEVCMTRSKATNSLQNITIEGHAEYAEPGQDIVCAGVSALWLNLVNSLAELVPGDVNYQVNDELGGYASVSAQPVANLTKDHLLIQDTLFESCAIGVLAIARDYADYVTVTEHSID